MKQSLNIEVSELVLEGKDISVNNSVPAFINALEGSRSLVFYRKMWPEAPDVPMNTGTDLRQPLKIRRDREIRTGGVENVEL